jgi:hypothetical protein
MNHQKLKPFYDFKLLLSNNSNVFTLPHQFTKHDAIKIAIFHTSCYHDMLITQEQKLIDF